MTPGILLGWACFVALIAGIASAQTGTFLDKRDPLDVRVVTYNLGGFNNGFSDSGFQFANGGWEFVPSNERVVSALGADVWAFQEVQSRSASDIQSALDRADPLPNGGTWNVYKFSRQVIASRHPFGDTFASVFGTPRSPTVATIDLPFRAGSLDLHLVNIHLKAGGSSSDLSQRVADIDRIIEYLREAQTPGGPDDLPDDTPFIVLGDFNDAPTDPPVVNLVTGDIQNNNSFGPDALLDWDDTELTRIDPRHNGSDPFTWTFRSNSFTSRLDYQVYSDSTAGLSQSFILNTQLMSAGELNATGLGADDVLFDPSSNFWDHLPVVADYSVQAIVIPEPGAVVLLVVALAGSSTAGRRRRADRCSR